MNSFMSLSGAGGGMDHWLVSTAGIAYEDLSGTATASGAADAAIGGAAARPAAAGGRDAPPDRRPVLPVPVPP